MIPIRRLVPILVAAGTMAVAAPRPVQARHRQTPPIVRITSLGDNHLPRVAANGTTLVFASDADLLGEGVSGKHVYRFKLRRLRLERVTSGSAINDEPTVDRGARVAFSSDGDLLGHGLPGRQIYLLKFNNHSMIQVTEDPTGTSGSPAMNAGGRFVAFTSAGDLAGTGNGSRQIFLWDRAHRRTLQITHGGNPGPPAMSGNGRAVAFASEADLGGTGNTVRQIFIYDRRLGTYTQVTSGKAPSYSPALDRSGRWLAFVSRANLLGDGADAGVSQVFLFDVRKARLQQLTAGAADSRSPFVDRRGGIRVGFVSDADLLGNGAGPGQPYYYSVRQHRIFQLPVAGPSELAVPELGTYFMVLDSNADLLGDGTPGRQLYLINLFKAAPIL